MSLHARGLAAWFVIPALVGFGDAPAQTIADYSQAQRAWLETTMSQSAARAAGTAASTPLASLRAPESAVPTIAAPLRVAALPSIAAPSVQVNGVFKSGAIAVAEVLVNATAYLLEPGQPVPGTPWQVDAVAVDRVVLTRQGGGVHVDGEGTRRVFSLPAMR